MESDRLLVIALAESTEFLLSHMGDKWPRLLQELHLIVSWICSLASCDPLFAAKTLSDDFLPPELLSVCNRVFLAQIAWRWARCFPSIIPALNSIDHGWHVSGPFTCFVAFNYVVECVEGCSFLRAQLCLEWRICEAALHHHAGDGFNPMWSTSASFMRTTRCSLASSASTLVDCLLHWYNGSLSLKVAVIMDSQDLPSVLIWKLKE